MRRISGSIWGLKLKDARQIYLTKIRPTISYACAAWFVFSPNQRLNWALNGKNIAQLERLQYSCLKKVSGALSNCSARALEKELNIEHIRVYLYRLMLSHRAKSLQVLDRPPYVSPVHVSPKSPILAAHPCQLLAREAQDLCGSAWQRVARNLGGDAKKLAAKWLDPKTRKDAIAKCAKQDTAKRSAELWNDYRRKRAMKHPEHQFPLALVEDWHPKSFQYYKGLTRAQSTMLLQCRTEFIGLNHFLHGRKVRILDGVRRIPTSDSVFLAGDFCRLFMRIPQTTVFHMFVQCEDLRAARIQLKSRLGHTNFKRLMTEEGAVVSDWAITFFNLDQFVWPRQDSQFRNQADRRTTSR